MHITIIRKCSKPGKSPFQRIWNEGMTASDAVDTAHDYFDEKEVVAVFVHNKPGDLLYVLDSGVAS